MKRIIFLFMASGALGLAVSLYVHQNSSDVTQMQTFHSPARFVKQIQGDKDAGRKIFKEFCAACHAKEPSIDIEAPRIGDKKAWENRHKLGISALLKITINGAGAMPARGGCFECSDEQLREAIDYILINSR